MGKASRWMINFLLGRKEEKGHKQKHTSFYEENVLATPRSGPPTTPKRRWSFGRSNKDKVHKSSRSFDSIPVTPLITYTPLSLELDQQQKINIKAKPWSGTEAKRTVVKLRKAEDRISKSVEDAAATRIQAAYRSHLARKALCALRALVKLQALVRGHLVRKQTTATLRQMHALMAIQVRARFQRIQMADQESQLVVRSQSSRLRNFSQDNRLKRANKEAVDVNLYETQGVVKNRHGYVNHSLLERRKQGKTTFYSGELTISKREREYEEFSFSTANNSPQPCSSTCNSVPGRASFTCQKPDYVLPVSYPDPFQPSYMTNTESSKAKARSQSEPKQRPKWSIRAKNKRKASVDGTDVQEDNDQTQALSLHSKRISVENQDPWFMKPYESAKSRECDGDAGSTTSTNYSNYSKLLVTYEQPHLNLY